MFNNEIYKIIDFLHVKPGKGSAFIRTKIKNLINGKIYEKKFPSGHKIKQVYVESFKFVYLYKNKNDFIFMNMIDYNQISIQRNIIKNTPFLKEGLEVNLLFCKETSQFLKLELPINVIIKVEKTEQGIKGDRITNTTKPAILETGDIIQVPLFINPGDFIKINTEQCHYVERFKKKNK